LRDASQHRRHPANSGIGPERGAEWAPRIAWLAPAPLEVAMAAPTARGEDLHAEVNHGRWIVACPDCGGAQLACRSDTRFMCNECGNVSAAGSWRKVVWPQDAAAIDAELAKRLRIKNQNWIPGETVDDLRAEAALARFDTAEEAMAAAAQAGPMRASEWEGHTHVWPKAAGPTVTCGECGLTLPSEMVAADQRGG